MDPVTLGVISAVGAGVSFAGQIAGGSAARQQAEYQATVARNNQTIAEQRAQTALEAGQAQAQAQGLKERARQGSLRASLAASGLDVNTGSAEDLRQGTAETGTLDQLTTEHNAMLDAYGYQGQATGFQGEAGLQDARASNAMPAALLAGTGSLLSSASKLPLKYQWMAGNGA